MFYYLYFGVVGLILWGLVYWYKHDLRKPMLWGSILYPVIAIPVFFLLKGFSNYTDILWRFIPDYWNPSTLLNLGRITGGFAFEDVIFMFFLGGFAAIFYELMYKKRINKTKKKGSIDAIVILVISTFVLAKLFTFNPLYILIIPHVIGWLVIIYRRRDLLSSSIKGALFFLLFYFSAFLIYNNVFFGVPWTFENLSGIILLGVPIEELGYGFTFALVWGPLYKYIYGEKNV